MVSSAVYRYVASRDELLTLLIVEAYDALGDIAERAAGVERSTDLARWVETGLAIRHWALANPHQYLLLYGTPVPGYAAPVDTAGPGTRVSRTLVSIVDEAFAAGRLRSIDIPPEFPTELDGDLRQLAAVIESSVPPPLMLATLAAWTQMFGLLSFELTSQTRGIVEHHAELFRACLTLTGASIGLR